jgi:hypothetical protein
VLVPRFRKHRGAREAPVSIGDPRFEGWESVSTFEDQTTALAWRNQLRGIGLDAKCVADHPLDPVRPRRHLPRRPARPVVARERGPREPRLTRSNRACLTWKRHGSDRPQQTAARPRLRSRCAAFGPDSAANCSRRQQAAHPLQAGGRRFDPGWLHGERPAKIMFRAGHAVRLGVGRDLQCLNLGRCTNPVAAMPRDRAAQLSARAGLPP